MVAKQLRTVLDRIEVWAVASNFPDEGLQVNQGGNHQPELPSRTGASRPAHTEARAGRFGDTWT
jgi:hypothetical protein